ncbi:MAG TPA: PilZ domain-containing protein [Acidobacteriota bacterium]|nr:PilZ domain-containing protein [Acidobacteriota bacterium]
MAAKDSIMRERRRHERFDIHLPIEAVLSGGGVERVIRSRSLNICAGGAYFPSTVDFKPGTRLSLKIEAPTGALSSLFSGRTVDSNALLVIKTECEIMRSATDSESANEFGLGVKFGGPMRIAPKTL